MKTIWKRFSQERPVPGKTIFIRLNGAEYQRTAFVCVDDNTRYQLVGDNEKLPLNPKFTWCYPEEQETLVNPCAEITLGAEDKWNNLFLDSFFLDRIDEESDTEEFICEDQDCSCRESDEEGPTERRNPKNAAASTKVPLSTLPVPVLCEVAGALGEGMIQYGKHNWRGDRIEEAEYYDAALRHLMAWIEGQDIDPKSGIHHVSKAIAGLMVLRDAQIQGLTIDNRPPPTVNQPIEEANERFKRIREETPDCQRHFDRESIRKRADG